MLLKGLNTGIRPVRSADLETLTNLWEDLSLRGDWFPHSVFTESGLRKRFNDDGFYGENGGQLLVCDLSGKILGVVFFFQPCVFYPYLEIGYCLFDVAARGRGHVTEAVTLLTQHLFHTRRIGKLLITFKPENTASRRVAEKCGYTQEGIDRAAVFLDGRFVDTIRFSLTREDHGARRASKPG